MAPTATFIDSVPALAAAPTIPSGNYASLDITTTETRRIVPTASGEPVELSCNDLAMTKIYMHMHYLFSAAECPELANTTLEASLGAWEEALRAALERLPCYAGSIRAGKAGRWFLHLDGTGAELQGAVSSRSLAGGVSTEALRSEFDEGVSPRDPFIRSETDPLLVVRLTRYSCGSLSVVTSIHHWVGDFSSYMHLIGSVAEHLRGGSPAAPVALDFSRDVSKLIDGELSAPLDDVQKALMGKLFKSMQEGAGAPPKFKRQVGSTKVVAVRFRAQDLTDLKDYLVSSTPAADREGAFVSTMDALHILLWSAVTNARGLDPELPSRLMLTMDGRGRMDHKDAARDFFGNVHPGTAYELNTTLAASSAQMGTAAHLLRRHYVSQTSQGTGPELMRTIMRYQQQALEASDPVTTRVDAMYGHDVLVSNLSSYPILSLDFGTRFGGRPSAATMLGTKAVKMGPFNMQAADGTVTILPASTIQQGHRHPDVVATIGLREADLPALVSNKLLRRFGTVLL